MADDLNARDSKLIQYLNEAYGKEKELETALQAHIKMAKTELWNEHEEIGNYLAIETLADALDDKETSKLAREFRRQEERMAAFLTKLIPQLTKAVVTEEVPASERRADGRSAKSRPAKSRAKPAKSRAKPAKSRAKPAKS